MVTVVLTLVGRALHIAAPIDFTIGVPIYQCCGMFFGLCGSVRGTDPDPSIIKGKKQEKNFDSYCFVTSL
jgi:hypothetical protein